MAACLPAAPTYPSFSCHPIPCLQIVALANLLPGQHEADDLDSYMYQTVGHQVVGAYAQCMRLPLYRRRITGQSADQVCTQTER